MSEQKLVPELRFPGFEGEWSKVRIGKHLHPITQKVPSNTSLKVFSSTREGLKPQKDYYNNRELANDGEYGVVPEGAFVYRHMSDDLTFKFNLNTLGLPLAVSKEYPVFKTNNKELQAEFLLLKLNYGRDFKKFAVLHKMGGTRTRLYFKSLCSWITLLPHRDEQQKIADFLSSVDAKLAKLGRKKTLLEDYKRGLMQQIFSQKIRFKQDDGSEFPEWEKVPLVEVFTRVTRKNKLLNENVLTISAQQGLVSQIDYFNKAVSAKDLSGYTLLVKDDFAYNKSYSKGYPMGAIKRLVHYEEGIVSSLYICFSARNSEETTFYEQYFASGIQNHELHKIAQEGARNHGLLNMSVVEFFNDILILRPCRLEQQKIADFLSSFDQKFDSVAKQIKQLEVFKKGLLQKLFV